MSLREGLVRDNCLSSQRDAYYTCHVFCYGHNVRQRRTNRTLLLPVLNLMTLPAGMKYIFDFSCFFLYSVLKLFTGLDTAALIAWKLIAARAIVMAISVVSAKTVQLMPV